jgi:hypothetical protein
MYFRVELCGAAESGYMECNLRLIVMRLLSLEKCIYMRVRSIFHVVLFIDVYCGTRLVYQNIEHRIR